MKTIFLTLFITILPKAYVGEYYIVDIAEYIQNGKTFHYELGHSNMNTWRLSESGILENDELLEPQEEVLEIYYCSDITCGVESFGVSIVERTGQGNPSGKG